MQTTINIGTQELQAAIEPFLRGFQTTRERIAAIQAALESPAGKFWRRELGNWTLRVLPVELLVPEVHRQWRPLVREAMLFVVSRLSAPRLAPKVVEQMEMPAGTPPEVRLLQFISKVPGLQKIGQTLARNRNLDPRFRKALTALENGISDVGFEEIRALIVRQLGPLLETYGVRLDEAILSEASVSAVVRFTWRNPQTCRRERGVFKVLKPHIPGSYAEDMKILEQLAAHLAGRHRASGIRLAGVAETLSEIRLLLEREVDFRREQATLLRALRRYRAIPGVRVPQLIEPLSTDTITALSRENGVKVTEAFAPSDAARARLAERVAEALIAVPALTRDPATLFHADPHAGNLLYDRRRQELVILDWALTERLSREQRRQVLMLVSMILLRDAGGVCRAIERLRRHGGTDDAEQAGLIRARVSRFLDAQPLFRMPSGMDAVRLLDEIALEGVRFPAALLIFRKASFTLEGLLEDIAGPGVRVDSVLARYALAHWIQSSATLYSVLTAGDWVSLQLSAWTFLSRLGARMLHNYLQNVVLCPMDRLLRT